MFVRQQHSPGHPCTLYTHTSNNSICCILSTHIENADQDQISDRYGPTSWPFHCDRIFGFLYQNFCTNLVLGKLTSFINIIIEKFTCFPRIKGKEMTVDVEPNYTIAKIKELLEEKEGIPVREYILQQLSLSSL